MLVLQEGKQVTDLIYESKKLAVVPSRNCGIDGFSAAVGLFRALKNAGKNVFFIYPYSIPVEASHLIKREELTPLAGTRGLTISIDYSGTNVEKLNYLVDGEVFKLTLQPVTKDFNTDRIKFTTSGFDYDLIISLGAQKLSDHETLLKEFGDEIKKIKIVNIDNSTNNENFGIINVVEPDSGSLCQLVLHKITMWRYKVDKESARALLFGISHNNNPEPK